MKSIFTRKSRTIRICCLMTDQMRMTGIRRTKTWKNCN